MKTIKLIFASLCLFCSAVVFAHDFKVDGIYYNITDETSKIVEVTYKGSKWSLYSNEYTGRVVIPESVDYYGITYSVTSIGEEAFKGCSGLTSIIIPNSVTSIAYYEPFKDCSELKTVYNLSTLTFEIGITKYGYVAYYADKVINAPNGSIDGDFIWYINHDGRYVLAAYLGAATELILPTNYNGENYVIGNTAFKGCSSLTSIVIPDGVTSIGDGAFAGCDGLTSVTIPNSVTSIGGSAFSGCSGLTSIVIPDGVTSIGEYAFYGCSGLTSITIDSGVKDIAYDSFHGCDKLEKIYLNTAVVGAWFDYTTSIKEIVLGSDVTSIGKHAFYGCSGLTSVTIGNGVTSIGEYAFYGCSGLTSIEIPNSVTSIGDKAFIFCSELKTVYNFSTLTFEKGITRYGYVAYYADKVINAPNGFIDGDYVWGVNNGYIFAGYLGSETELVLPQSCNGESYAIGAGVFENNTALTSIEIPNSVTSIGNYAFEGCKGLTNVTIGDGVTSIGGYAFSGCSGLTNIAIPNSITSIGSSAFYNCSGLTSIVIPDGVTNIGYEAFRYCSSLETLYISNTIESIGDYAFANCNKILDIKIGSKRAITASKNIFSSDAYNNAYLYVPVGRKDFYAKTLPWSNFIIKEMDFTGIDDVKEQTIESNVVYDLGGRVVENPTKGIYIINGKKVLIK